MWRRLAVSVGGSGLSSRTGDEMTADPVMRRNTNTAGGVARPPLPRIRGLVTAAPAANWTKTGGRLIMLEKVLRSESQRNPTLGLRRTCIASCVDDCALNLLVADSWPGPGAGRRMQYRHQAGGPSQSVLALQATDNNNSSDSTLQYLLNNE